MPPVHLFSPMPTSIPLLLTLNLPFQHRLEFVLIDRSALICPNPPQLLLDIPLHMTIRHTFPALPFQRLLMPKSTLIRFTSLFHNAISGHRGSTICVGLSIRRRLIRRIGEIGISTVTIDMARRGTPVGSCANGTASGGTSHAGTVRTRCANIALLPPVDLVMHASAERIVEIMGSGAARRAWCLREAAIDTRIMYHLRDQARPAALMCGAETAAAVAVEELVEPEVFFPVGVEIEDVVPVINSSSTVVVSRKKMLQSVLEFFGDVAEMHVLSASCRTFDLQTVAVEHVEAKEGLDEEEVDASGFHG
jgi:hypothetical protein